MNIQAAGNTDSWNQFVRLVAEARTRSQGTAAASGTAARAPAATPAGKSEDPGTAPEYPGVAGVSSSNGVTRASAGMVRALGSFFDAYA